jgi:hypothetical protein
VVDTYTTDDQGGGFHALFRYDFDSPDTFGQADGSLGNDLESLIGPGDSGGPLLVDLGGSYALAGVNTFIEGYGGRFGDIGGGIVLDPHLDWITATTGIAVPEPSAFALTFLALSFLVIKPKTLIKAAVAMYCRTRERCLRLPNQQANRSAAVRTSPTVLQSCWRETAFWL